MQASFPSTRKSQQRIHGWLADQTLLTSATVLLLLALCLPVFAAERSPLNSDQSLYLAEAVNISSGRGLTYPTGEPIVHRAPLYPALIAGVFKIDGTSLDGAYLIPHLAVVANVLLLYFLGRSLFGSWGGAVAAVTATSSLYLRGLGTALFLDTTQVTFLLAALLVYWRASNSQSALSMATAGVLLGISFLIKEATVLFLPLPVVLSLIYGFSPGWKRALPAWFAGFAAATAWWWVWVYAQTGDLFLIGSPQGRLGITLVASLVAGAVAVVALLKLAPRQLSANRLTRFGAGLVLFAWNAMFFVGLEATAWQYDSSYYAHISSYMGHVFLPNVQPAPLILAAWVLVFWSAAKSRAAGMLVFGLLLYMSFFIIVADRGLSLRDQLPLVYFSYLALGGAAAWLVNAGRGVDFGARVRSLGGGGAIAAVLALTAIVLISGTSLSQAKVRTLQDDWENPLSRQTAAWISRNLEPGSTIMSSRLYYSHLYFLTGGAYQVHQLPTVEVNVNTNSDARLPLSRRSTLFRWENHEMPGDSASEGWLYLTYYSKGYFIGMAENDLLVELKERQVAYVVISTLDAGFSSPSFNRYFEGNPAFELLQVITATPSDEARVYRVDLNLLTPRVTPAQVTTAAYEYMVHRLGSTAAATDYLDRINPAGFELRER